MFRQADAALERTAPGLGIGLTLARSLVSEHGGTIEARSPGIGQGSEFQIRLPLATEAVSAPPLTSESDSRPITPLRILVVDDNIEAADALSQLLGLSGHEVEAVHDGSDALELAARFHPQAVLLDIGLPKMNGYDVCRLMRREPWGKDLAVIALTGFGQDADRQKSSAAGFDGHLVKPVELEAVLRILDMVAKP
jgi:CheY-like chemotaxis protein